MQTPFINGVAVPDGPRSWPLTVRRVNDGFWVGLVAPHGQQAIAGVHETLRPLLQRLPAEIELPFRCRVREGGLFNVFDLVAVELDLDSPLASNAARFLDDQVVEQRPELLAARMRQRVACGDTHGAIADFRHLCSWRLPTVDHLFLALSPAQQEVVSHELREWLTHARLPPARLRHVPMSLWSDAILAEALESEHRFASQFLPLDFAALLAEASRRGGDLATRWSARLDAAKSRAETPPQLVARGEAEAIGAHPEQLRPELLEGLLTSRDPDALSVYADALMEGGHVYGAFVALHLRGSVSALREARDLALVKERAWLGPLADVLDRVTYERGLPVSARFREAEGADLQRALAHPLARAFRRVLRRRSKSSGRLLGDTARYLQLVRALLPHALNEIDCADGVLHALRHSDCSRVTHLHDLDITASRPVDPASLPAVTFVGLHVSRMGTNRVLDALMGSHRAFFEALSPRIELTYVGVPPTVEVNLVRSALASLPVRSVSVGGEIL